MRREKREFSEELRDVFRLVTSLRRRKIEPQTFGFALRCSTTEPQRLYGKRGLLRSSYDTRPAYC